MDLIQAINPLYSLCGFAVGALVGMTGVGGGALMTPLLILLFGIHATTAVGTDLLYACITKTGGTAVHGWLRTVEWRVVRRLAVGSVPATALTLLVLSYVNLHGDTANVISTLLGLALLATSIALVFRQQIMELYAARVGTLDSRPHRDPDDHGWRGARRAGDRSPQLARVPLGVTALLLLYRDLPITRVVGSDIAHAVPLTLVAGAGHWALGSIDWPLLGSLLVGSLPALPSAATCRSASGPWRFGSCWLRFCSLWRLNCCFELCRIGYGVAA